MRPEILFPYFADLTSLPGVGPALAKKFCSLVGGDNIIDMLFHLPVRWVDRRIQNSIHPDLIGHTATLGGQIQHVHIPQQRGREPARITISDNSGTTLDIVYFRAAPGWLKKRFVVGDAILVSGMIEEFRSVLQIVHPDYLTDPSSGDTIPTIEPVYRKTAGVTDATLLKLMREALNRVPDLPEWLPTDLLTQHGWPAFKEALTTLHTPANLDADAFDRACSRLAFDEITIREIMIVRARAARSTAHAIALPTLKEHRRSVLDALPFKPTAAQMRVIEEIGSDLNAPRPMRRILQGDVGSGKTLIAAMAIAQAALANKRSAVMCPTEILARQQARTISSFLAPLKLACQPLTAAESSRDRRNILNAFTTGHIHALSGTQTLIQNSLDLPDLNLIVIDEHHRFGISDRMRLLSRASSPHLLVMTATPIPRTLAMMINADMDASILDQMPQGRIPVKTSATPSTRIQEVFDALVKAVDRGEQAYWICPAIESDQDHSSVLKRHSELCDTLHTPPGLIHGRMNAADKDSVLESFRNGTIKVLVATTVVEVGLDIPDARIMVIENAQLFGLAQLHQLRGRVGRGQAASSCLLLYEGPLSPQGRKRIEALRTTTDGFQIAQIDFALRGAGDLLGLKQSGLPRFKVFDPARHADLIQLARNTATTLNGSKHSDNIHLATELFRPRLA